MRAIARAAFSDGESIRDEDAASGVAVGGREAGAMAISATSRRERAKAQMRNGSTREGNLKFVIKKTPLYHLYNQMNSQYKCCQKRSYIIL